jgi:hypothetical protein
MTPLHLGSLHAIEVVLVVVLAVGPFLALAAAIVVARRRDAAELGTSAPSDSSDSRPQPQENSSC